MVKRKTADKMAVTFPEQVTPIPIDEYRGMGGQYILNPETGMRERIAGPGMKHVDKKMEITDESEQEGFDVQD